MVNRIVEYTFFFGLLGFVGYLVWQIISPFFTALALAAIIVTICFPLYERIKVKVYRQNESLAALLTTMLVLVIVILPVTFLSSALISEGFAIIDLVRTEQQLGLENTLRSVESVIGNYVPGFELDIKNYVEQSATWVSSRLGAIFAGTASTIFLFFIAMIGSFYFFKDGRYFTRELVRISPLPDDEDEVILKRLALAVRSVATGSVLVALIQGTLTAIGLFIFGFERAILWGTVAAMGALIPSVGTSIVFIPAVIYLVVTGQILIAVGVAAWGMLAVGLIDNLLGPYLMSRGSKQHPFVILLSVLGGIALFGPIGFIVGPVIISLFKVLLELYSQHISGQVEPELAHDQ